MGYSLGLGRVVWAHMGSHPYGALAFADDIKLLTPILSELEVLIHVFEKYANEFNITFNGSNSYLRIFKGRKCTISTRGVTVKAVSLNVSERTVHLGHHTLTKDKECTVKAAKFSCRYFNLFISDYGHICSF